MGGRWVGIRFRSPFGCSCAVSGVAAAAWVGWVDGWMAGVCLLRMDVCGGKWQ